MTPPLKEDLIKLVEFELRYIEELKRGSGFTGWVLFAAAGGIFWRGLAEIPDVNDWGLVAILWASSVLFADFLSNVYRELSATPEEGPAQSTPRFFSAQRLLSSTRPYLIFVGVKITMAAGFLYVSNLFSGVFLHLWITFFGFHLFGWLSIVGMTLFDSPFDLFPKRTGRARSTIFAAASLAQILSAVVVVLAVVPLFKSAPWSELRFAFLAFAFVEVATFMLSHHITHPMRDTLLQFRRALVLDTLKPEEIKSRLDVLLHGAEVSKFLQPRVKAFLDVVDSAALAQDASIAASDRTFALCSTAPTPENNDAIYASLKIAHAEASQAAKLFNRVNSLLDAFDTRAMMVKAYDPRSKPEVDELLASMKAAMERIKARRPQMSEAENRRDLAYDEFKRRMDQGKPSGVI